MEEKKKKAAVQKLNKSGNLNDVRDKVDEVIDTLHHAHLGDADPETLGKVVAKVMGVQLAALESRIKQLEETATAPK